MTAAELLDELLRLGLVGRPRRQPLARTNPLTGAVIVPAGTVVAKTVGCGCCSDDIPAPELPPELAALFEAVAE